MRSSSSLSLNTALPIVVAVTPRSTKTTVNPATNNAGVTGDPEKVTARSLHRIGEVETGDDRQVAGDDGQHARRDEGGHATAEGREVAHRIGHLGPEVCPKQAPVQALARRGSLLRAAGIGIVGWDDAHRSGTRRARCRARLVAVGSLQAPGDPGEAGLSPGRLLRPSAPARRVARRLRLRPARRPPHPPPTR